MKRTKLSKLSFTPETLRHLTNHDLSRVGGGQRTDSSDCLTPNCPIIEPIKTINCETVWCKTVMGCIQ